MADDTVLPFNIDPVILSRYMAGGVLAGGGVATALELYRTLQQAKEDKKRLNRKTDENQIVLTLPKRASVEGKAIPVSAPSLESIHKEKVKPDKPDKPTQPDTPVNKSGSSTYAAAATDKQLRETTTGRYGMATKSANWPTLTTSLLGAAGGGAIGFTLIEKLNEVRRKKEQEAQLEAAQQEYLDMLSKAGSSPLAHLFTVPEQTKSAFDRKSSFDSLDYPMGLFALATLLGAGGSAYITKKVLDEYQSDQKALEGLQRKEPKITKIVFRTAGSPTPGVPALEDAAKTAAANDDADLRDAFNASLGIYLDICSGEGAICGKEKVAAAATAGGITVGELYKQAADDYAKLMATLQANPELRSVIQRAAMEKHPVLRYLQWANKVPGIKGIMDRKLYSGVSDALGHGPTLGKQAGLLPTPDLKAIMSSFYGSEMAEHTLNSKEKERAERDATATAEAEAAKPENRLKDMTLEATDPAAAAFLAKNKERIAQVVAKLVEQQKL